MEKPDPEATMDRLRRALDRRRDLVPSLAPLVPDLLRAARMIVAVYRASGKVLLCGNGGSQAQALHLEAELVGRFVRERAPLPAIALGSSLPTLTALSNDFGEDQAFARALEALARPGDAVLAFSTSGCSRNVVEATRRARTMGLRTIAFTGRSGGDLAPLADLALRVPFDETAIVQEAHLFLAHILVEAVESELFGEAGPTAHAK